MVQKLPRLIRSHYKGLFIGLLLATALSIFAFTEPTLAPPGGNVAAPLNVSATPQTKAGDLTVNAIYAKNFSVAPGVSEYNISNVNAISGFNDLFLKGNSTESAPVYLAGSEIRAYTGGVERLTITGTGNVGIGAITPGSKLTVEGIIESLSGGIKFPDGTVQTTAAAGGGGFWAVSGANISNTNSGNVGIGTASPENRLHIRGGQSWGTGIDLDARDVGGGKQWRIASTGGDAGQGQGKLVFHDNSTGYTALTIQGAGTGSGRVGIGTTNPTSRLDVVADFDWPTPTIVARGNIAHPNIQIKSDQPGSRDWRIISCGASGCGPTGALRFFDNSGGGDRMVIMPDGNVGIGTTQPGFKLTVAGKIYSSVGVDGESLCIKGDCKTAWSQVGGSGGFGGMYTMLSVNGGEYFCSISNPKTGGCSCPGTAPNSTFVHRSYGPCSEWTCSGGTRYIWDLYMCWQ